jgi:hypothetical protein
MFRARWPQHRIDASLGLSNVADSTEMYFLFQRTHEENFGYERATQ